MRGVPERPEVPAAGEFVRIREARWRVLRCDAYAACALIEVAAADGRSADRASFLLPFDRVERLPAASHPRRVRPAAWRRVARRVLADARQSWWSLQTPARARLSLLPFQLEPAIALARGQATRLLIADAVGLGKTIQAGLIIAETLASKTSPHVLVVCPAALRAQWQGELEERFGLQAMVLDGSALAAAEAGLPVGVNPWSASPLLITSIDFVKRPDIIRALEPIVWDVIVFDEAHGLAGRSDRATAAAALARRARAVVMLTATPHSGDEAAFARLCELGRLDGDPPLATFRRPAAILGRRPARRTTTLRIRPTAEERQAQSALDAYCALADGDHHDLQPAGLLALMVLRRRAASSARSLARSLARRISLLENAAPSLPPQLGLPFGLPDSDDDEPELELAAPALQSRGLELDLLRELHARAVACERESKVATLVRLLRRARQPAIVFTQYRDTLQALAAALDPAAPQLHGGMSLRERQLAARRFTHGDATLLLATDAASEGLNLHYRCRLVVNLEQPWTPLRLEQRIGRVDRLGQERRVHAVHFIAAGTEEEALASRLRGRSQQGDDTLPASEMVTEAASAECSRVAFARTLETGAATCLPSRPVITAVRPRPSRSPGVISAFRVPLLDAAGVAAWEWVAGWAAPEEPHGDVLSCSTETLALAAQAIAGAAAVGAAREQAIAADAAVQHARMSAALLQRGLFDRRHERAAAAQAGILASVLAATDAHLAVLNRLSALSPGAPRLLFTLCRQ